MEHNHTCKCYRKTYTQVRADIEDIGRFLRVSSFDEIQKKYDWVIPNSHENVEIRRILGAELDRRLKVEADLKCVSQAPADMIFSDDRGVFDNKYVQLARRMLENGREDEARRDEDYDRRPYEEPYNESYNGAVWGDRARRDEDYERRPYNEPYNAPCNTPYNAPVDQSRRYEDYERRSYNEPYNAPVDQARRDGYDSQPYNEPYNEPHHEPYHEPFGAFNRPVFGNEARRDDYERQPLVEPFNGPVYGQRKRPMEREEPPRDVGRQMEKRSEAAGPGRIEEEVRPIQKTATTKKVVEKRIKLETVE